MTYTLSLCLGMFLAICGQQKTFDFPSAVECETARKSIPAKAIGNGYAVCAPKKDAP